jgi:hypothetical protein
VYIGMRRATVIVIGIILAIPALAQAKAGVEFQTYPETAGVGEQIAFTVIALRDAPPGGGSPQAIAGRRPLVTFRSASGRVLRIRVEPTNADGIARGTVAFPDKGPWTTALKVGQAIKLGQERSQPIRVGVGLTQTIPAATSTASSPKTTDFPWVWVLSLASVGSALLVLVMRRRGHWGAA